MDKPLANNIGRAARRARIALHLTQEETAARINVSLEFYARIERGRSLPSVKTLLRIANALNVSADVLLGNASFDEAGELFAGVTPPAVRVRRRRREPEVSEARTEEVAPVRSHGEAA